MAFLFIDLLSHIIRKNRTLKNLARRSLFFLVTIKRSMSESSLIALNESELHIYMDLMNGNDVYNRPNLSIYVVYSCIYGFFLCREKDLLNVPWGTGFGSFSSNRRYSGVLGIG